MASWAQMAAVAAGAPEPPPPAFTRLRVQQQAAQQERAHYQPQGEHERVFLLAVDHCFARWSLLRLAVDMGWGDGGGAHNVQLLKEATLEWLQRRRAVQAEPSDLEEVSRREVYTPHDDSAHASRRDPILWPALSRHRECLAGGLNHSDDD
jgi:hypothetical protein